MAITMQPSISRKKIIERIFIALATTILIIAILIPYGNVFIPADNAREDENWKLSYVWDDFFLSVIYFSLLFFWAIYLVVKNQKVKRAIKIILLIVSACSFLLAIGSASMPVQDFIPYYGVYVSILILPIISFYLIYLWLINQSKKEE
jgi:uncharacterized BrkB/YihY/UPF0761 family membrane protein